MSIEKSVNFLQPGGTFSAADDQGSQRFVAFRSAISTGISISQELRPTEVGECSDKG